MDTDKRGSQYLSSSPCYGHETGSISLERILLSYFEVAKYLNSDIHSYSQSVTLVLQI